jgi:hypothetical protein
MQLLRTRLVAFTLAVLASQVGLLAAAPIALCRIGSASVADASTCTCDHADGVECPMHKGAKRPPAGPNSGPRVCTGCGEQAAAIVTALTTSLAVLEPSSGIAPPRTTVSVMSARTARILDLDRRPASPPPRS